VVALRILTDAPKLWHGFCYVLQSTMTKVVTCVLAAVALALNAQARDKEKDKDKYRDKDRYNGPVVSRKYNGPVELHKYSGPGVSAKYNGPVTTVPDNGSTLLLLGTTVLVLGLASRRFSIH
jgi:hypothetical protein